MIAYDPESTMREARARYFEDNDFGDDGGYGEKWVDFKLGPVPFPFPNTPMRVRAVRYHDLHHVITGYDTDLRGEFEISAWEIAAGCRSFVVAWQLNLGGLAGGVFLIPRRTFHAFLRGRHSQSLYGQPFEPLLDATVDEVRGEMRVPAEVPRARVSDVALFGAAVAAGLVVGTTTFALGLVTLPAAYVAFAKKARAARARAQGSA